MSISQPKLRSEKFDDDDDDDNNNNNNNNNYNNKFTQANEEWLNWSHRKKELPSKAHYWRQIKGKETSDGEKIK